MRKHLTWWLLSLGALVVLLYPQKLTIVPAYRVKLVDQSGAPMANATVSELWQQTSSENMEHLVQVATNAEGEVDLPEHTIRSALAERFVGCLGYLARQGLSASCGNRYAIIATGEVKELERKETVTGLLNKQHSLVLTLKSCEPDEPVPC
jgi:hypothetical protein